MNTKPTIPTEELEEAMEKLSRSGVGLCTEDPAKYMAGLSVRDTIAIRERIEALEALLKEARIYVDECFGDLDRSLSSRIDQALTTRKV